MQSVSECDAHLFLALIFRNLISVDGDKFNLIFLLIVWKDMRTLPTVDELCEKLGVDKDHFRELSGLPISSISSALKIRWLKKHVPAVRDACRDGRCLAGTIDSWIVWNLIKGLHVTDVTNASRTVSSAVKLCFGIFDFKFF